MKNYITFIFIIFTSIVYTQNIEDLDKKNGFKTFNFGQNFSELKDNSKMVYSDLYEYTGEEHKELFGVDWNKLFFAFCDDKLFAIEIDFNFANNYKYELLLESLEKLFGKSKIQNNFKRYNRWDTDKTYMYIRYLKDNYTREKECNTCNIQIEIGSKLIENECLKNEF